MFLPEFGRPELRIHMELYAGKGPDGLVCGHRDERRRR